MLTNEELAKIVKEFLDVHEFGNVNMPSCSACGVRQMERCNNPMVIYEQLNLVQDGPAEPLWYSDAEVVEYENMKKDPSAVVWIPINAKWTLKKAETWKLKLVYEEVDENDVKTYWHVHPELVEKGVEK